MHWNPAVGIPLLIIGLIVFALIWLFGKPRKPEQGRRVAAGGKSRQEPTLDADNAADTASDDATPEQGELDVNMRAELERLGATLSDGAANGSATDAAPELETGSAPAPDIESDGQNAPSTLGRRPAERPVERIISLFVTAHEGQTFQGGDLLVVMEKAGLEFGDMGIFHRLLDGQTEDGAVFSVANMVKPGRFDLTDMRQMQTPGLSVFMALPGPLSALDAWDTMLPTAQRLARLLDGMVLDADRNALGRQGIAYMRDDLRAWDRQHADGGGTAKPG